MPIYESRCGNGGLVSSISLKSANYPLEPSGDYCHSDPGNITRHVAENFKKYGTDVSSSVKGMVSPASEGIMPQGVD